MPKIYQAYYKDVNGYHTRHHGTSQVKVEQEARQTAKETGLRVTVDVIEIEKPSVKSVVGMLNGDKPTSRTTVCFFEPTKQDSKVTTNAQGVPHRLWKVKRKTP